MVSTVKKSQATIPAACWRRNARQVVVVGRGAGSSPWRRSVVRIVVAETETPRCWSSPLIRWYPQARVLPGQANDQLYHVLIQRWSAGLVVRVDRCAGHQASVPAQQRLRPDEETGPVGSGQHATDGSEQHSVGGPQPGSSRLAAQHRELVAQNEDLQILGGVATGQLDKQLDGAAQRQVGESWQHLGAASATR